MSNEDDGIAVTALACIFYPTLAFGVMGMIWTSVFIDLWEQDQIEQQAWRTKVRQQQAEAALKEKESGK